MKSKIKPNAIVEGGSQFGTTIHHSDPAKFRNTGSSQKKKGSGTAQIMSGEPHGTTFQASTSHISLPSSAKMPKSSKTISESMGHMKPSESTAQHTVSKSGSGGPSSPAYPLSRGYEKSGKTGKKSSTPGW